MTQGYYYVRCTHRLGHHTPPRCRGSGRRGPACPTPDLAAWWNLGSQCMFKCSGCKGV